MRDWYKKIFAKDVVRAYAQDCFRLDLFAGLTVAVVAVPQSMAYAVIAGLPPVYGLYTAIVSAFVASLLGSSSHLITGPANATAFMFAATLQAYKGDMSPLQLMMLYTFMIGAVKLAFGIARFGGLVKYVSDSVIIGFLAGAGILIAGNQLSNFLGVPPSPAGTSFVKRVLDAVSRMGEANPYALGISLGTAGAVLVGRRIRPNFPTALVAFVISGFLVFALGLEAKGVTTVGGISAIPRTLPPYGWVPFNLDAVEQLLPGAVALAVIGLMEVTALSKTAAQYSGQRLDANREFLAQGTANMVGAFFHNFAASGSLARTLVNVQAGAKTRLAGMFAALFVAVALLTAGPLGEYIPIASLAGLLMVVAGQMCSWQRIRKAVRAGRESSIVLVVTIVATLVLRIDYAIYLGVAVSLAFFVRRSSVTRLTVLQPTSDHRFHEAPLTTKRLHKLKDQIAIVNVIGALYFSAVEQFLEPLRALFEVRPRVVVLRLRRTGSIDSGGLDALEQLHKELTARGIPLILCGVDERMQGILKHSGIADQIGEERIMTSDDIMFHSMERTLELAKS
ncbi:MAG: SulP family inorganic anion transporter, partial [Candidatus Hydrogenedentota bacterium]